MTYRIAILRTIRRAGTGGISGGAHRRHPYVPGFLSFREYPALLAAWGQLRQKPGLIFVDGHGISHPAAPRRRQTISACWSMYRPSAWPRSACAANSAPLEAAVGARWHRWKIKEQLGWVWRSKGALQPAVHLYRSPRERSSAGVGAALYGGLPFAGADRWSRRHRFAPSGVSALVTAASGGVAMSDFGYSPQIT